MSKTALVTGGRGFLGSHVCPRLDAAGYIVLRNGQDLTRGSVGISEPPSDLVVHLAAACGGIGANQAAPGQFFYDNLMMGMRLMDAARMRGVNRFLTVGTVCSYPKHTPAPFKEDDLWNGYPEETNAPYGIAKKALLVQGQAYREQYGLSTIYLILANLYGPRDHFGESGHVIPAIIRKVFDAKRNGKRYIHLWGDGSPTRDFLYVTDAADAIVQAADRYDDPAPVNIGTGVETSIGELAERIVRLMDWHGAIVWDDSMPNGQPRRVLDTSRAKDAFGWNATTALDEGLRETIEWYECQRR